MIVDVHIYYQKHTHPQCLGENEPTITFIFAKLYFTVFPSCLEDLYQVKSGIFISCRSQGNMTAASLTSTLNVYQIV